MLPEKIKALEALLHRSLLGLTGLGSLFMAGLFFERLFLTASAPTLSFALFANFLIYTVPFFLLTYGLFRRWTWSIWVIFFLSLFLLAFSAPVLSSSVLLLAGSFLNALLAAGELFLIYRKRPSSLKEPKLMVFFNVLNLLWGLDFILGFNLVVIVSAAGLGLLPFLIPCFLYLFFHLSHVALRAGNKNGATTLAACPTFLLLLIAACWLIFWLRTAA